MQEVWIVQIRYVIFRLEAKTVSGTLLPKANLQAWNEKHKDKMLSLCPSIHERSKINYTFVQGL